MSYCWSHGHYGQNVSINPDLLQQCPGKLQGSSTSCSCPVSATRQNPTGCSCILHMITPRHKGLLSARGKSECFQFYWLVFKSNQILLLKRDNGAALAAALWLRDHQGVRNQAAPQWVLLCTTKCLSSSLDSSETPFLEENRDLASIMTLFKAPFSSQLLANFLALFSMCF